jgi:hypothetical protein
MDEPVVEPAAWKKGLKEVVSADLEAGNFVYYEEDQDVHAENIEEISEYRQEQEAVSKKG